jgi:hypothetical protein
VCTESVARAQWINSERLRGTANLTLNVQPAGLFSQQPAMRSYTATKNEEACTEAARARWLHSERLGAMVTHSHLKGPLLLKQP